MKRLIFITLLMLIIPFTTLYADAPVADFSATPLSGTAPLSVTFTDLSTESPFFWVWKFGDGTPDNINQNPTYIFTIPGVYTITLSVVNGEGNDTETKTDYITVTAVPTPPVAAFSGTPVYGDYSLTITFTDASTNIPTSWLWNFGDDSTSILQSPNHTYNLADTFTVTLTVTNAFGSDDEVKTNYVITQTPMIIRTYSPNQSTVLIVKAEAHDPGHGSYKEWNDSARRNLAQVYSDCAVRGINTKTYYWDGKADNLKTMIRLPEIEFVIFVGGSSWNTANYIDPVGKDNLAYFWSHDTSYCNKNAWVWFHNGTLQATDPYVSGALTETSTYGIFKNSNFYTANYPGEMDTLGIIANNPQTQGRVVFLDPEATNVDTILTFTGRYLYNQTVGHERYAGVWSRTENGVIRYYTALCDGGVGMILDAKICKHVTHFRKLQLAFDMDDHGTSAMMNGEISPFPHSKGSFPEYAGAIQLTDANFWDRLDGFYQLFIDYDLKLTIGIQADDLRNNAETCYADSNQWKKWYDIARKYKDDPHFQFCWHNHGYENSADSVSALFRNAESYNDYNEIRGASLSEENPPTVAIIDSIYQADCDSIKAWGLTVAPYFMAPWDAFKGLYENLGDTITAFIKLNNLCVGPKGPMDGYPQSPWNDYIEEDDIKVGLRYYISLADTSDLINESVIVWNFWGSNFGQAGAGPMSGFNPNIANTGTWNSSLRVLRSILYSKPNCRIGCIHPGPCFSQGGIDRNTQLITKFGELIKYLEWLAGNKDLYESVFPQDLDMDQVR